MIRKPRTVGQLEKQVTKAARKKLGLPSAFKLKVYGPGGWDVRSDAKLRKLRG